MTKHTPAEKGMAAALYAFLADFSDYEGATHRRARAALRGAGFEVRSPPGTGPAARVRIDVRGGVATFEAEGDVEVELVDHDGDEEDEYTCSNCSRSESDGAESMECEDCELCTVCCPHRAADEGEEDV